MKKGKSMQTEKIKTLSIYTIAIYFIAAAFTYSQLCLPFEIR